MQSLFLCPENLVELPLPWTPEGCWRGAHLQSLRAAILRALWAPGLPRINILSYLAREGFPHRFHSCQDPVPPLLPLLPDSLTQQITLAHPRGALRFSHLPALPACPSLLPAPSSSPRPTPFVSDLDLESSYKPTGFLLPCVFSFWPCGSLHIGCE